MVVGQQSDWCPSMNISKSKYGLRYMIEPNLHTEKYRNLGTVLGPQCYRVA